MPPIIIFYHFITSITRIAIKIIESVKNAKSVMSFFIAIVCERI